MSGLRLFYFILVGQSLSLLGSTLTNFALGVWAYKTGGNVTNFTVIAVASTVPGILLGPIIGSIIDRWDRKRVLFSAQLGSALVTLTLALLYWAETLQVWHILLVVPIASVCGTVLQIGFSSIITTLVPQESLSRANGSLGLVFGVVQLSGPILAGVTLDQIGMTGIFAIDIISYAIGLITLAVVTLPALPQSAKDKVTSLWSDIAEGYRFLKSKPGVLGGLYLFTLIWFNVSAVQVLILPLVLSIGTTTDLGMIQSMAGVGTLVGGLLMVAWKGPQRKMLGILGSAVVIACVLM
ncbi:MAG TPA: MFS transporter, partial [Dongiaceae bacterium]|nr:MFS transporter [Dongiaceae bacterium]